MQSEAVGETSSPSLDASPPPSADVIHSNDAREPLEPAALDADLSNARAEQSVHPKPEQPTVAPPSTAAPIPSVTASAPAQPAQPSPVWSFLRRVFATLALVALISQSICLYLYTRETNSA